MQIILCDDEEAVLKSLKEKIKSKYPKVRIKTVTSGEELLSLSELSDIIFLDIEMPGLDGMETAKKIRQRDKDVIIIFLTGFDDKVFEAFEVNAFRYLLKPVSDTELYRVIESAIEMKRPAEVKKLMITANGTHLQIPVTDIIYAEVFNRLIRLHTKGGTYEYYGRLQNLEETLSDGFFRCHRSYLINLSYITGYSQRDIYLSDRTSVPLSRQKYNDFVKVFISKIKGEKI